MFAVLKTGGKQYKVQKDSIIIVEKLEGEVGSSVTFKDILMVDAVVGTPFVKGASVTGEIVKQARGEKVIVFKKIRRHGYKRKNGHKQDLTVVKITAVNK